MEQVEKEDLAEMELDKDCLKDETVHITENVESDYLEDGNQVSPWLRTIQLELEKGGKHIGSCTGQLMDRVQIRGEFHFSIDEVSHEMSQLAFGIFDRWGDLKEEYISHPIKKGSGVWGTELKKNAFLVIDHLKIHKGFQLQGYGKQLVLTVLRKAQELSPSCQVAFTWATCIRDPRDDPKNWRLHQMSVQSFWGAIGFRRVGSSPFCAYTSDPHHPSKRLAASDDYKRPLALYDVALAENVTYPFDNALQASNDRECAQILESRIGSIPPDDMRWTSTDQHGNNILHFAARRRPQSLALLLKQPFASELKTVRNLEGETPLEHLQAILEAERTTEDFMGRLGLASDDFKGYGAKSVKCLSLLVGLAPPSEIQRNRIKFGCTCGRCLCGFLSPRMAYRLFRSAIYWADELPEDHQGVPFYEDWPSISVHWESLLARDWRMRVSMAGLFHCIRIVLRSGLMPTESNVLAEVKQRKSTEAESPSMFLGRGGTVASAVLVCFDYAIRHFSSRNSEALEQEIKRVYPEKMTDFPRCRNDQDPIFVKKQYCRLEGVSWTTRRTWM